jgi:hypothetical protein
MANTNAKLHGKNAAIYLGAAKGSGGVKVASKTDWTLRRNRDYVDATVFGDTNKTYLAGLPNVEGTFAGLMDTSGDLLLNAATSDSTQIFLYADDGGTPILIANGPGLIDGNVSTSSTDAIRFTGEFRASGAWTIFEG